MCKLALRKLKSDVNVTSFALVDVHTTKRNVRQERCILDVLWKNLSPELSKQRLFATVEKYKSYSSLAKKYDIFSLQTISLLSDLDMHKIHCKE